MTREKCIETRGDGRYKRSQIKSDRTKETYASRSFSHNPEYCIIVYLFMHINRHLPRESRLFRLRITGALADQIEDAVAISYEEIAGISRQHRTRPCW